MDGYVALGSNEGERLQHLQAGLAGLASAGLPPLEQSSIWETAPVDSPSPAWFLNMVVRIPGDLAPLVVLERLLEIERGAGRVRTVRNAARTLDLDLLLLGDAVWRDERLTLPHPRMWQRRFVLEPLRELAPQLRDPATGQTIMAACRALAHAGSVVRPFRL